MYNNTWPLTLFLLFFIHLLAPTDVGAETTPKNIPIDNIECTSTAITATNSGLWNASATWGGGPIPTDMDQVTIPANITVTLNNDCFAQMITVFGVLTANNNYDFDLFTEKLMVNKNTTNPGILRIGTLQNRYTRQGTITLVGDDDGDNNGMGDKVLGVMGGGEIHLHGVAKTPFKMIGRMNKK